MCGGISRTRLKRVLVKILSRFAWHGGLLCVHSIKAAIDNVKIIENIFPLSQSLNYDPLAKIAFSPVFYGVFASKAG